MPFNRHRRDKNHREIVMTLRAMGCGVLDISQVGDGCPDLAVGIMGRNYFLEVKSKGGALSPEQTKFHDDWLGERPTVVYNCDQVREWVLQTRMRLFRGL